MSLENQVCSLELSKLLNKFGIKQESLFYWIETGCTECSLKNELVYAHKADGNKPNNFYSAFTASEIGELLPNRIFTKSEEFPFDSYTICINKFYSVNEDMTSINNYILNYECDSTSVVGEDAWFKRKLIKNIFDPNLANAMAKMLIYLIESGLLKNER